MKLIHDFPSLFFDRNGSVNIKRIPKKKTNYTDPKIWKKDFIKFTSLVEDMISAHLPNLPQRNLVKLSLFIFQNKLKGNDVICEKEGCCNFKRFNMNHNILQKFCSHQCYAQHEPSKEKRKETCQIRYGQVSYSQTQNFKDQYKETMNINFGVNHNFQLLYQDLSEVEIWEKQSTRSSIQNEGLYFNRSFIEEVFFDKDYLFKLRSFMSFFNVSQTAAHSQIKRLNLKWTKYSSFSSGEIWIKEILENNKIIYFLEHMFSDCVNPLTGRVLRFDFYLPNEKICIEYDGAQHSSPVDHFGGELAFRERQILDLIKDQYCSMNAIKMIRVDHKFNIKEIV